MQAMVRGSRERQKFIRWKTAALDIQSWWRAVQKGQQVRRVLAVENSAARVVQRFLKMVVDRKQFIRTKEMVVRLQAVSRGWLVRKDQDKKMEAVKIIQDWWRRVSRSREESRTFEETKRKVVIIQSVVRRWVVRRRYLTVRRATVTIQRWVRVWKTKMEFKRIVVASSTIQRHWRNCQVTRQAREQFLGERKAAVAIQAWWRLVVARKQFRNTQDNV